MAPQGWVVVTGGSRGIGAATARACARAGYDVCFSYLTEAKAGQAVAGDITALGREVLAIGADTGVRGEIQALFEQATAQGRLLRGLVNNAGIIGARARVADVEADVLEHVMSVNVVGVMLCAQRALRHMSKREVGKGGAILMCHPPRRLSALLVSTFTMLPVKPLLIRLLWVLPRRLQQTAFASMR